MDSEQETQAPVAAEGSKPSDDSASSTDNAQDYDGLTVAELKTKLKESGLPVSGKKSELIERLVASNQEMGEVFENKKETKINLENFLIRKFIMCRITISEFFMIIFLVCHSSFFKP